MVNIKSAFIRKRNENYNVYIEYIDENGKTKQKSKGKHTNKKDAEKHLIELKSSINNNKFIVSKDITFVERYNRYIIDHSENLSPVTISNRESIFKVNIEPFFKDLKLEEVTPYFLQNFINEIFSKYAKTTAKSIIGTVKVVINEAYRLKEISENPCDFVKSPRSKNELSTTKEPFDKEECSNIIKKLDGSINEIPILLMLTCGLRRGEACGLRWQDVDFDNKTISINQVLIYVNGKGISFKEPKTKGSIRTISAPDELMVKLKKLKMKHNEYKLQGLLEYEDLVCLNSKLLPWVPCTLQFSWDTFLNRHGIRKIRIHDLRHTHATMLVLAGTDFKTISNRLGHTDIKITMNRYSHVLEEMDRKASENISNIMF